MVAKGVLIRMDFQYVIETWCAVSAIRADSIIQVAY